MIQSKGQPGHSDGQKLTAALQASTVWLEAHFKIVNEQNVFPVPDGDTGTNMVLTMRAATEAVSTLANPRVDEVAAAAAKGALFGARGNSGIILSQFLQGFAPALAGAETLTARLIAKGVALGAKSAADCVAQPVEGTLLTVLRATAEAAQVQARLGGGLTRLVAEMVAAARLAQAKTPELLPVLKEAGVTDSGGLGFVYLLEGIWRWLEDKPLIPDEVPRIDFLSNGHQRLIANARPVIDADYGYDVQFLLHQASGSLPAVRAVFERLGWSVLVVGRADILKVHLHTRDPAEAIATATRLGSIDRLMVEDMQQQARVFTSAKVARPVLRSTIAVVEGAGFVRLFQSLGASCMISGARGDPPPVGAFLAAINQVPGDEVVILPNSDAAWVTASQAQTLTTKRVAVIRSRSMPQGLAALLAGERQPDWAIAVRQMTENAAAVQTMVLKSASTEALAGQAGQIVGRLNGGQRTVGPSSQAVILELFSQINLDNFEIVTLYFGQDVTTEAAAALADALRPRFSHLTVELHEGGQSNCHYIVTLE